MDIIFIRELRIETLIGVHPWERQARRELLLDLELEPISAERRQAIGSPIRSITRPWRKGLPRLPPPATSSWWRLWPNASRSRCCGNSPRPGCG